MSRRGGPSERQSPTTGWRASRTVTDSAPVWQVVSV